MSKKKLIDLVNEGEHKMQSYIGHQRVHAFTLNRQEYNSYRGWTLPEDEDGADLGMLVIHHLGSLEQHESWTPISLFAGNFTRLGLDLPEWLVRKCVTQANWSGRHESDLNQVGE